MPTRNNVEPTTSVTDELRRLLDERGADYRVSATGYSIDIGPYTTAYANRSDTTLDVSLRQVTPEQAIAATLGAGTCHLEINTSMTAVVCNRCNYSMPRGTVLTEVHFCPNCGRRIEVDG